MDPSSPAAKRDASSASAAVPQLRVLTAEYLKSGPTVDALGPPVASEFAFVGRSNVGKSSLLNTLTKQAHLVRTSRTPGQTRSINLFHIVLGKVGRSGEVTERRRLVLADLPGYGFAEMSKADRQKLSKMVSHYLSDREGLRAIVQLFDARHAASAQDVEVFREIAASSREHILVATKADKLPVSKRKSALHAVVKPMGISPEGMHVFSSETGLGRERLLLRLWELAE